MQDNRKQMASSWVHKGMHYKSLQLITYNLPSESFAFASDPELDTAAVREVSAFDLLLFGECLTLFF